MAHPSFNRTRHRPWPLPENPWRWRQSWCDLLFAHWPVPVASLRPLVPESLEIQEFDGISWIGIVPFRMEGVMLRPFPDLPWVSAFPELNVRLYVTCEGKPGVWFLSLDAGNPLAVWAARRFFHLPYYNASFDIQNENHDIYYRSSRKESPAAEFQADYRPVSSPYEAGKGTLEHWLTERYCLYARDSGGALYRSEVHHRPWPLQKADAEIRKNTMAEPFALELPDTEPLLHFASRLDVVIWPPVQVTE